MVKALNMWEKVTDKICYFLSFVAMIATIGMWGLLFVDSMLGLYANKRILGVYEMVQLCLFVFVFISWAYTQSTGGHIHVTLFISKFPRVIRFLCFGITSLVSVITMVFGTIGVYRGLLEKMDNGEKTGTLLIPIWPMYLFEFAAFILLVILLLHLCVQSFVAIFNQEMADYVSRDWT